jgi:hypothetical protein
MSNHFSGTNTGFLLQTSSRLDCVTVDASGDGAGVYITGSSPEQEDPFTENEQLIAYLQDQLDAVNRLIAEDGSTDALTGKAEGIELAIAAALRFS